MKNRKRLKFLGAMVGLIALLIIGIQSAAALNQTIRRQQKLEELRLPIDETHEAYTKRGSQYSDLGEQELAIADFNKAAVLHGTQCPGIYHGLGLAYARQGNYEQAIEEYDRAIAANSNVPLTYSARGDAYAALGDTASALASYDKAIELEPGVPWHYWVRGHFFTTIEEYAQAQADFQEASALDPTNPDYYHVLAWVNRLQGNWEGALNNYLLSKIKLVDRAVQAQQEVSE